MRANYHTTTSIWLSLEDFHNAGLTSEQTKEAIEKMEDPLAGHNIKLKCRPMGINGNWIVETQAKHPDDADWVVSLIEARLGRLLKAAA